MPWHPVIVHFPIVLLTLAVGLDVLALVLRRPAWHLPAWRGLVLGTLMALAAVLTGDASAADYRHLADTAERIQDHEDAATMCLLLFAVVCFGRLPMVLGRRATERWLPWWIGLAVIGVALLVYAGDLGGELVYRYGVGVQASGR